MNNSIITKVLQYIDEYLDGELSLDKVASAAHTSPFHFHRLFKTEMGETLNSYITRRRIEKAASILIRRSEISISELSLMHGFSSNSSFTRTFKKYYGVSPSIFREESPSRYSKISQVKSKNGQHSPLFEEYICNIDNQLEWIDMNVNIEVKELAKMNLAYMDSIGAENLGGTYARLVKWAAPKGLMDSPDLKMITVFHDSFKITPPDKVRMSACILLDDEILKDDFVSIRAIEGGRFIVAHMEIGANEFPSAWGNLFVWMNENGYKKADQDPFEIYHNDFNQHPEKKCIVDLCIPAI